MNWQDMTVEQHNAEYASRLRGLAAMVESCDRKVKIRMSARLTWDATKDRFETPIVDFPQFIDRFTSYTTERTLEILKNAPEGDPTAEAIRQMLRDVTGVQTTP